MSEQTDYRLEEIKKSILKRTTASEKSYKCDKLIEEFAKRVIAEPNSDQPLEWIRAQSHELGQSESIEDLREALSTNYFILGFMIASLSQRISS